MQDAGASRRGNANVYLAVIARSEATKQSILSLRGKMDCFASLAMTAGQPFAFSQRIAPEVLHFVCPSL